MAQTISRAWVSRTYLVLPVLGVGEGELEVVIAEVEHVDAATFAGLVHLAHDYVGVAFIYLEFDLLACLAREVLAVECQLAARSHNSVDQRVVLI